MSRIANRGPIWARPAPGIRQPRFTREQIAAAAIAIADQEGFAEVSMRRVAERIGAGTMTLYHYVRTKADLLSLMEDALMGESLVPEGELPRGWRLALTAIARRARDAMLKHPWALHSRQGLPMGPNNMRHIEQSMAAIADAPLPPEGRLELIAIVDDFVFGYALRAAEAPDDAFQDARAVRSFNQVVEGYLKTRQFPFVAAFVAGESPASAFQRAVSAMRSARRFEVGIQAILDGAERRPRQRGARRAAVRSRKP